MDLGPSGLDVYAPPYVPEILKAINNAPATVIEALPARWINFGEYVQSFAGSRYLQADPPPPKIHPAREDPPENADALLPALYHVYFTRLIHQETDSLHREIVQHNLFNVPLAPNMDPSQPCTFALVVPGLRELNLRIEIGDIARIVQLHFGMRGEVVFGPVVGYAAGDAVTNPPYVQVRHDAVVWSIDRRTETLILRVDNLFPGSMRFNVCFTVQTSRLGALHRAVACVQKALSLADSANFRSWMRATFFPDQADGAQQTRLNKGAIAWKRRDRDLNYEQIRAIDNILARNFGQVPYLISGPPGTGKTKTCAELALQIILEDDEAHLLICAPSDQAADLLTERLRPHFAPGQLLRLNGPSRSFPEVPMTILSHCFIDDDMFSLPPFGAMMRCKIVVTTCRDAEILLRARLANADLHSLEREVLTALRPNVKLAPKLHWTGLLIDEAAQAIEPEACIPICVVAPPGDIELRKAKLPLVVMAGDQNQLGPRTADQSKALQTSIFERLLERPLYRNHIFARSRLNGSTTRPLTQDMLPIIRPPFTDLIRNYRSHPAILAIPSSLFYHDTLEPEAVISDNLLSWNHWQGRRWPVLFVSNSSNDEIEQEGGGWYNNGEAALACDIAHSLIHSAAVEPKDICVMTPFRAQVKHLRTVARTLKMHDVNIGPLEAFQGLESKVVILCTTRTRERFLNQDIARGSGVVCEPKRFNVAMTRAKEGLIAIGNPDVLVRDASWTAFLAFCKRNGLVRGGVENVKWLANVDWDDFQPSRLERYLVRKEEREAEEADGLVGSTRLLGVNDDEEQSLWEAGIASQRLVEEGEEEGGEIEE